MDYFMRKTNIFYFVNLLVLKIFNKLYFFGASAIMVKFISIDPCKVGIVQSVNPFGNS